MLQNIEIAARRIFYACVLFCIGVLLVMAAAIFIVILYAIFADEAKADTEIGRVCYAVEPFGAHQDNAIEECFVVEIGDQGSGTFSSVCTHEDIAENVTTLSATSIRTVDRVTGETYYTRKVFGVLGKVKESIELGENGDVRAMYEAPRPAIVTSTSMLHATPIGLRGIFIADVWDHDLPIVRQSFGFNSGPGLIYGLPCDQAAVWLESQR